MAYLSPLMIGRRLAHLGKAVEENCMHEEHKSLGGWECLLPFKNVLFCAI
jgi:hypothetical protein